MLLVVTWEIDCAHGEAMAMAVVMVMGILLTLVTTVMVMLPMMMLPILILPIVMSILA